MSRSSAPLLHRLALGVAASFASTAAFADAQLGRDLVQRLGTASPGEELEVVVTFERSGAVGAAELAALRGLGIDTGVTMRSLPIVGALATPSEIAALARRDDVASIWLNSTLRYHNLESRQISGAARAVDHPRDYLRALPFSGRGVGVVVHDSGVDATHMDLQFGTHVVENVQAITNLHAQDAMLPITYLEGMPNTDISSGHGTHVAGTVGGTGERSGGRHRGVAPGASLVGYGSGAAIAILDAVGGFDYAITNQFRFDAPLRVVTNSWGGSGPFDPADPVNVASYEAYKRGMVVLFAAGNDGPGEDTHNPYAQAPWVISVGAGEKDGVLTSFSSRGKRGERGDFTMPDGTAWTYVNEPTVVATGVDVISTRTFTGALPPLEAPHDAEAIDPAHLPFYTHMSGTSMATPHVAGIVALVLEANPGLDPLEVKDLLERTATNMSGRLSWEAGAGHVNAYAALAEAAAIRGGYGATVNPLRSFHANALLAAGPSQPFSVDFMPVGTLQDYTFQVGPEVAWVAARATIGENTLGIALVDPSGERYTSAISLPLLGSTVVAGAPGKPGTWRVQVRGIGSVSGNDVDPLNVTNGYGLPDTVTGQISFLNSAGFTGLGDIAGHPAKGAIEYAVAHRLVDGYSDSRFRPDQLLKRSELAQYLVMGASVRQDLPLDRVPRFSDVPMSSPVYAFAESAVAKGAPLRNLAQDHDGVMRIINGQFKPNNTVTRAELAYALVQAMGLQEEARAFAGSVTVAYNGTRIALEDDASIPADMKGHVQLALDQGLVNARFTLTQGPFDLQPKIRAWFDPGQGVSRAFYAVSAGRFLDQYRLAED